MRSMIIYGIILGTSQHFDLYHMLICPLLWSLPFERSEEFFHVLGSDECAFLGDCTIGLLLRHDRLISGDFLVLSVRPVSLAYELYTRFFSQP